MQRYLVYKKLLSSGLDNYINIQQNFNMSFGKGKLILWDCSVYCGTSIIFGFCLPNANNTFNYRGNQIYPHKFPKCLFRDCIPFIENSCSEM